MYFVQYTSINYTKLLLKYFYMCVIENKPKFEL